MHYGHPRNIIRRAPGINMGDGWETARKLDRPSVLKQGEDGNVIFPGKDWTIFKLATEGVIKRIEIDTTHFKGNFPESFMVEGCRADSDEWISESPDSVTWATIYARSKLGPNKRHLFNVDPQSSIIPCTHVRLSIFPDGKNCGNVPRAPFPTSNNTRKSNNYPRWHHALQSLWQADQLQHGHVEPALIRRNGRPRL